MTPSGMAPCKIEAMKDFKGADVDRLHPGTEGVVFLQESDEKLSFNAKFSFFVRKIT
jgi:putative protease